MNTGDFNGGEGAQQIKHSTLGELYR